MNKLALCCLATVVAALTTHSACAQTNLVQNPGFETGDLTDWPVYGVGSYLGVQTSNPTPNSGNYEAYFGAVGSLAGISQTLTTVPGLNYNFRFYLASDGQTPNEFQASFGSTQLFDSTNIAASGYVLESFDVVATDAATTITFGGRNDQGYLYLDDVSVTAAAPEPSTWAMLAGGAGLLLFLRVRQHQSA